jgi:hypothetical protein
MALPGLEKIQATDFLKANFDTKAAGIICVLLALLNKSLVAWLHTDLEGDKALYLLLSQSILEGHLPLEPAGYASSGELLYKYNAAIASPLYTWLAVPLLYLTRSFTTTSGIIDVLSWAVFLTGLHRFALLMLRQQWAANVMVLCCGFFIYPHELQSGPKDTMAVGLILWSVWLIHRFVTVGPSVVRTVFTCLVFLMLGMIKFLYVPLVVLFLGILFYYAIKRRGKRLFHVMAIETFCTMAGLGYYLYLSELQKHTVPFTGELPQTLVKSFSPEALVHTYPFISSSILNTNFWSVQLSDIFKLTYDQVITFFQLLDIALLVLLVLFFRVLFSRLKGYGYSFLAVALLTAGAILLMVFVMAVQYEPVVYAGSAKGWSFVQDARSFLFPMVFLQAVLFYYIFRHPSASPQLRNFLLILFFIESLHGGYFTIKRMMGEQELRQTIQQKTPIKKITNFITGTQKQLGAAIILSTPDPYLRRYALLNNIRVQVFAPCDSLRTNSTPVLYATFETDPFQCPSGEVARDTIRPYALMLVR